MRTRGIYFLHSLEVSVVSIFNFLTNLAFGTVALIALTELVRWLKEIWRRRQLTPEDRELEDTWALGGSFNMRRPDSELRGRHVSRETLNGRLAELNKPQKDPYDP